MSGTSIVGFAVGGMHLASALGGFLALDPAEAAARNDRIRHLTEQRRNRRAALEAATAQAADDRERLAQAFITLRVDAAAASAALAAAGLPADPGLVPPDSGPAVENWCRSALAAIHAARDRAATASAGHAMHRLRALLSDGLPLVAAADVLAPVTPGGPPTPGPDLAAVVTRMLATLDARALTADRERVDEAAAAACRGQDRQARLTQLRLYIQEANDRIHRQRDDAVTAAQLLDAIEPYGPTHGLDPELLGGARAALAEVVAGTRELDDALLDLVAGLREVVEARAAAATVTDAVADVLGELGYLVGSDFTVGEAAEGMLAISHPERPDHHVRMRVDATHRQLISMVYRSTDGRDEKADTEAEAAWCGALDRALAKLANSQLILTPVLLTAPGSRPTPATTTTGAAAEVEAKRVYRTNQRSER